MQTPHKSMYGQMVYVAISGLQLLFIPNTMLGIFGFPATNENWVRVMGLLVLALLFYYNAIAKSGNKEVLMGTVYGRTFFSIGLVSLGILGIMPLPIIFFGIFELALAFWTWREVQN